MWAPIAEWLRAHCCVTDDPLGGESFVQLITGINFVFFAFRELDPRKGELNKRVKTIRDTTLLKIEEIDQREGSDVIALWACAHLGKCHDALWSICRPLALVAGLIGVVFLYAGVHGELAHILALPLSLYLVCCVVAVTVFSHCCRLVRDKCNASRPEFARIVRATEALLGDVRKSRPPSAPPSPSTKTKHE